MAAAAVVVPAAVAEPAVVAAEPAVVAAGPAVVAAEPTAFVAIVATAVWSAAARRLIVVVDVATAAHNIG